MRFTTEEKRLSPTDREIIGYRIYRDGELFHEIPGVYPQASIEAEAVADFLNEYALEGEVVPHVDASGERVVAAGDVTLITLRIPKPKD